MSSVWAKLVAVAAVGDPAKFRKCSCDKSDHAGWTFDPAKEEVIHGAPPLRCLQKALRIGRGILEETYIFDEKWQEFGLDSAELENRKQIVLQVHGNTAALLGKNESYRVPHSAEEERRRFRRLVQELMEPLAQLYVIPPSEWPMEVAEMEREVPANMMERLIWHYDPRLQLIRYPSFRLFIEVQLLRRSIRDAVQTYEEHQKALPIARGILVQLDLVAIKNLSNMLLRNSTCVAFYAMELEEAEEAEEKAEEADEEVEEAGIDLSEPSDPAPPTPAAASEARPSLTRTQRRNAKQKAKKLALRQAKEEAAASSSRSDFLPKIPAPKPPTAAPKKKKSAGGSETTGETAGCSWAVVESGLEGQDESGASQRSSKPAAKKPPIEEPLGGQPSTDETAAAAPPDDEPTEESPKSPGPAKEPTVLVAPVAPLSLRVVEPVAPVAPLSLRVVEPVEPVAPQLPVVEAVGPSGAFAVLAHDLARIADRLRRDRLA